MTWQGINGLNTHGEPWRVALLEQGNPQAERVMHQWRQATEARLHEAQRLVEQAARP